MNLLSERLKWAMQEKSARDGEEVKPADIARAGRVSATSANYWLNDVNGIGAAKARLLGDYLSVDPLWLETGKGTPRADKPTVLLVHPDDPPNEEFITVPESRIEFAAGNGRSAVYELVEDREPATYRLSWFQQERINPDRVRRFRVYGDSMEPFLYARDTILVNTDETNIVDGRLYAIRYGDDLRVKYLRQLIDGTIILHSVNPLYEDEKITPELASEHISVIGRVRDKSGRGGL